MRSRAMSGWGREERTKDPEIDLVIFSGTRRRKKNRN